MNQYTESLKAVWNNSVGHVSINFECMEEVAQDLARQDLLLPKWNLEVFPQTNDDVFIGFLVVSGAINYCFTDFTTEEKYDVEYPEGSGKVYKGADAMFAALKRAMDEEIDILDPRVLRRLDLGEVNYIFRHVSTPLPMIESRLENLRELGRFAGLLKIDDFSDFFRRSGFRIFSNVRGGLGIAEVLAHPLCHSYRDSVLLPGAEAMHFLEFNKRAQLVPMMYHGRAMNSGGALEPIKDPENFGPICDYQVPRALRFLKVITYSPDLARRVDSGILIEKESPEEIEIRAIGCARAMCLLLEGINKLRRKSGTKQITHAELDSAMWRLGRHLPKEVRHHYTYTTAY